MDKRNEKGQFLKGHKPILRSKEANQRISDAIKKQWKNGEKKSIAGNKNPGWKNGEWAKNPRKYVNDAIKSRHKKARLLLLNYYGGIPPTCKCCGENEYKFLSIDHIIGGRGKNKLGGKKSGYTLYRWLIKKNFPEGFQVLCHNCNMAKGLYGECPHGNC